MADKENVQISSNGIRNSLKRYDSYKSIAEYVWNGFDANATQMIIDINENKSGKISSVIDNTEKVISTNSNMYNRGRSTIKIITGTSDVTGKNGELYHLLRILMVRQVRLLITL